ncbi:phosphatidylglycerol--prolipoprotein diacylglyceryl transferase-like [Eupeodes corollae]|uniref:phosphatidylglycerol--prolipoprotein diacylglyceryl transferase-like n=1 Tax=Eupeodes corollae TaxID=290404 RepID=UPI0024920881|nr:phosphatidylglycerol--prolipoprotein diacylglyceryl transferase-like [Eupeodes corollae]
MASFIQKISIALIVSLAICSASPARLGRLRSNKSKFLARQEVAEDIPAAQTPYPPAGIQPEVKFALPTEEELNAEPEKTYLPPAGEPAKTYGPPETSVKDDVEQFANDEPQPEETKSVEPKLEKPDVEEESSEQPEESDEEEPETQDNSVVEPAGIEAEEIEAEAVKEEEEIKSNLPARLVRARSNRQKSAKLQIATPQQIARPIYYFNYNGQLYRILN